MNEDTRVAIGVGFCAGYVYAHALVTLLGILMAASWQGSLVPFFANDSNLALYINAIVMGVIALALVSLPFALALRFLLMSRAWIGAAALSAGAFLLTQFPPMGSFSITASALWHRPGLTLVDWLFFYGGPIAMVLLLDSMNRLLPPRASVHVGR